MKQRQGKKLVLTLPEHVHAVKAKGRVYYYYQPGRGTAKAATRVRLPDDPRKPEFWVELERLGAVQETQQARSHTFSALIAEYLQSDDFASKSHLTKREYKRYLAIIETAWGPLLVKGIRARNVMGLRKKFRNTPAQANYLLRVLSLLIAFGIPLDYCDANPCVHVKKFKGGEGYEPWSWKEIYHHRRHASPEMARAAALALYTGQRQSDVLAMKAEHFRDGFVSVRQEKTDKRLWLKVHRDLQPILDQIRADRRARLAALKVVKLDQASPAKSENFFLLTTRKGERWTSSGFATMWQRDMAKRALRPLKVRGRVFHGLRKSSVVFLLEAGCTDAEVAAITGQSREMIEHYAVMVNQRKLAAAAILKWEAANPS
jgi:integrase